MDQEIVAEIKHQLFEIEESEAVAIPLAIESGSRAWGFPSPDSDYDCRFMYVRPASGLLSLFAQRDVIELPQTPVFDINGWELAKVMRLMLKGNAVPLEWLKSPLAYRRNAAFAEALLAFSRRTFQRGVMANHYFRLMRSKREEHLSDPECVPLKKLLYALRAAIALRYIRVNRAEQELPMTLAALCDGADLPAGFRRDVDDLVARKAAQGELGHGSMPQSFRELLDEETRRSVEVIARPKVPDDALRREADTVYHRLLAEFAP